LACQQHGIQLQPGRLGNYSTNVGALLSEVLDVQSELSEESPFTIGKDTYKINFTIAELMLGLFCFVVFVLYLLSFYLFFKRFSRHMKDKHHLIGPSLQAW
jgi:hypothetical protein